MSDLRKVFKTIQQGWGHDVLLQRRVVDSQSGIYSMAANNGFSTKLERYTVRHMYPRKSQLSHATDEFKEGLLREVDLLFYFQHDAKPKEGDRILEADDRFSTAGKPGFNTYVIDFALPQRGVGGRVEYWMVGCTREHAR